MRTTAGLGSVRARSSRSVLLLGLGCVFLASMATVAIASTGDGPRSAIPQPALDRLLKPRPATAGARIVSPQVAIPRTPAGEQLAWLLAEVNGGSATLTQAEVRSHVSKHFLAEFPADRIVQLLKRSTTANGPVELTGVVHRASAIWAVAQVTVQAHRKLVIRVRVDAHAQHRIVGLDISDAERVKGA
jgi:hypothetical protein